MGGLRELGNDIRALKILLYLISGIINLSIFSKGLWSTKNVLMFILNYRSRNLDVFLLMSTVENNDSFVFLQRLIPYI